MSHLYSHRFTTTVSSFTTALFFDFQYFPGRVRLEWQIVLRSLINPGEPWIFGGRPRWDPQRGSKRTRGKLQDMLSSTPPGGGRRLPPGEGAGRRVWEPSRERFEPR